MTNDLAICGEEFESIALTTQRNKMDQKREKIVIVGGGPVGSLAALYAAQRGHEVEVYELRSGTFASP